jgi:hypothetical protein
MYRQRPKNYASRDPKNGHHNANAKVTQIPAISGANNSPGVQDQTKLNRKIKPKERRQIGHFCA